MDQKTSQCMIVLLHRNMTNSLAKLRGDLPFTGLGQHATNHRSRDSLRHKCAPDMTGFSAQPINPGGHTSGRAPRQDKLAFCCSTDKLWRIGCAR